jgi:hypothetical protein
MLRADEPDERGISGTAARIPYGYERTDETATPEAGLAPSEWPAAGEETLYRVEALRDVPSGRHRAVYFCPGTAAQAYLFLVGRLNGEESEIVTIDAVDEQAALAELSTFEEHGVDSFEGAVQWVREQGRLGKPTRPA